jgi:hypothetical protein
MSPSNQEPEKYSLDHMMERLKNSNSTSKSGEAVIRADGREAEKTKKRKRRSKQGSKSKDNNHKEQIIYIGAFFVILAIFGIVVGTGALYANSVGFRNALIKKLETATGAKLSMRQFRMNPLTANAATLQLDWPEGGVLSQMTMHSIFAKTSPTSVFSEMFRGDGVVVQQAQLNLKAPDVSQDNSKKTAEPLHVSFPNYLVNSFDLVFGNLPTPFGSLTKSEVTLQPNLSDTASASIRLKGGALSFPNWPALELDRSYMIFKNSELFIQSMRFRIPLAREKKSLGNGMIEFSGSLQPAAMNPAYQLSAELDGFDLKTLLGPDLGSHINGMVDTRQVPNTNFLRVNPNEPSAAKLELAVTNALDSRIELDGFPFLTALKVAFDDNWYEFPNFDEDVSFDVKRTGAEIEIREIRLERRGRIALRGSLTVDEAGGLSGKWQVGIPQSRFSEISDKKMLAMFREVKSGYRWVEIEISGSQAQASDNFRAIYDDTLPPARESENEVSKPALDSFESLILGQ